MERFGGADVSGIMAGALLSWEQELVRLKCRLAPIFRRRELQQTGSAFLDGLLSGVERKTAWLMAEQTGAERPYRMQSLLGRSNWDSEKLRDHVRAYDVEAVGVRGGVHPLVRQEISNSSR